MVLNIKSMNGRNQDICKSEAFIEFMQKEEISFMVFVESIIN